MPDSEARNLAQPHPPAILRIAGEHVAQAFSPARHRTAQQTGAQPSAAVLHR
jgi:hypothetical protein